jgi:PKHD-type hydroxylase
MLAIADLANRDVALKWMQTLSLLEFQDGKSTAGFAAQTAKRNRQLVRSSEAEITLSAIQSAIENHPLLRLYAKPKAFTPVLINRYETNDEYAWHTDNTRIAGCRTDLSYTLFLSELSSYDGGELCLQSHLGEANYKLDAGQLFLYPSNAIHCVKPVTRGIRIAAVGWIESELADAEIRSWCFDLNLLQRQFKQEATLSEQALKLAQIEGAILRRFARA